MILFKVPGIPRPWPKKTLAPKKGGGMRMVPTDVRKVKGVKVYGTKQRWIEAVRLFAVKAIDWNKQPFPIGVPVIVSYEFYLPKPKKAKYNYMVTTPDLDNLAYAVTNALKGIIYHDDCQVVQMTAVKIYADGFEPPCDNQN
ncbi:MAG: RusA family crossover junction endodeoxyribonuclease [bacterium]